LKSVKKTFLQSAMLVVFKRS